MILRIFSCKYCPQRKALTAMGIMGNRYQIGIGIITDRMNTRYLTTTDMIHTQQLLVCRVFSPCLFTVDTLDYLFGQGNGSTTGMIQFMHMMGLFHLYVILRELVHDLCQITVHSREDGHTDGEVRGPEERLAVGTGLTHLITMLLHPSCRAGDDLDTFGPSLQVIAISSLRSSKLDGYVSRSKSRRIKVLLIINIDNTHDFMTTVKGDLLNHFTHLPVAD